MLSLLCWFPLGVLIIGSFFGCSRITLDPSPLSSPFFTPTAEDTLHIAKLTHELDNKALHCLESTTYEQVHFARALVSLFENHEAARASYRRLIEDNPSSSLAASSRLWVQLIG